MLARLVPNKRKILEAILFIIELAGEGGAYPTQYDIVKSVFAADIFHIKKYGRPVTFDNYAALQFGPVPSETYDMLKPEYDSSALNEDVWPIWNRKQAPDVGSLAFRYCDPKRPSNHRKLSQTDREELTSAFHLVKTLGFKGTRDWTHENPAYKTAWENRGFAHSNPMDYAQLVEHDEQLVEDLVYASESF